MKYLLDSGKKSVLGMVLLKAIMVFLKTKCNIARSAAHICSILRFSTFFDEHKAQRTREEAKSGRWSTTSNHCPLDLFDGLDSGTALFLPGNFCIMFCTILYRESSEVIEGLDAILL